MRTNIFRSSEGDGNVPRADPFFHLIRMKMDSLLSGVTAICLIMKKCEKHIEILKLYL